MFDGNISHQFTNKGQQATVTKSSSAGRTSSLSSGTPLVLGKGQTIRGEIVDLRSNEVNVKLEDGRQLSGKLEDSVSLSIGDKVTLRVEEVSQKSITLKLVPEDQADLSENTIDRALDAAGLGKTENTRSIVSELLNQQMSIDRKTISLILQQSLLYKDSSLETLVLMNKYHLPVTDSTISQFEAYCGGSHGMMSQIEVLTDSIANLFSELDGSQTSTRAEQANTLLNRILNSLSDSQDVSGSMMSGDMISDDTMSGGVTPGNMTSADAASGGISSLPGSTAGQNSLLSSLPSVILTRSLLNSSEGEQLAKALQALSPGNASITQEFLDSIKNGTADAGETAKLINQLLGGRDMAGDNSGTNSPEASAAPASSAANSAAATGNPATADTGTLGAGIASGAMQKILDASQNLSYKENELGTFLPASSRDNLAASLDSFSFSSDVKERISSGEITSGALLKLIRDNLGTVSEDTLEKVFSTKEFKALIKEELISKWTFTPESLTREDEIDNHFSNMSSQLNELKESLENIFGNTKPAAEQANQLQENINFMKNLNDLFTYVQLPLKLKNQTAQGELYVYTRKKEGRSLKDGISVLLHLDMDNLGPVDIHLDLHHSNVVGKFYLNDKDTMDLIASHLPELKEALRKNGFTLNAELLKRKKEIDIVEDFIKQDAPAPSVTRYNFDIRA